PLRVFIARPLESCSVLLRHRRHDDDDAPKLVDRIVAAYGAFARNSALVVRAQNLADVRHSTPASYAFSYRSRKLRRGEELARILREMSDSDTRRHRRRFDARVVR